jgi:hypothetical protein
MAKPISIAGTIQTLERFYSTLPEKPSTDAVRKQAQQLPDPELAVRGHRFLPRKAGGVAATFTTDEVTEAFLQVVLNEETALTPKGVIHLRSLLRAAGRNLGVAFTELYDVVTATGCGVVPSMAELTASLRELLKASEGLVAADKLRDERRRRIKERVDTGELEPWVGALALEWLERFESGEPAVLQLEELLLDPEILSRMSATLGISWDVLATQARSHQEHRQLGDGLIALAEAGPDDVE